MTRPVQGVRQSERGQDRAELGWVCLIIKVNVVTPCTCTPCILTPVSDFTLKYDLEGFSRPVHNSSTARCRDLKTRSQSHVIGVNVILYGCERVKSRPLCGSERVKSRSTGLGTSKGGLVGAGRLGVSANCQSPPLVSTTYLNTQGST